MQLLVAEAILDFEKQFGYSVKVAIRSETQIFITYLLRPRETVCFVDPRPPLLPEVSVNKCYVI
jgi:hypothetical protein